MTPDLKSVLLSLKLHHLAGNLDDFVARATRDRSGPLEVIEAIARHESEERQRRSVERRLRAAQIGRFRAMADFDWAWPDAIDRERVERLLALDFLGEKDNVVLASAPGLGKTMIARNVAYQAVLAGHSVLFITAAQMLLDLGQQDSPRALQARLRRYTSPALICLDEVGYMSYDARSADLLFEIVNRRYERGSILLTTNLAFSDWPKHFPGAACVTAMIERITHHAEIVAIEGKSYRLKEAGERQTQKSAKPGRR